jgi:hypothetical protein
MTLPLDLEEKDRSEYFAAKSLDSERDMNAHLTHENEDLRAKCEAMRAALEPFAYIAEMDIGEDEADFDFYQVAKNSNARPTVGMFRRARKALAEQGGADA